MKTLLNTCVLAVILASFGNIASANFDDDDVRDGARQIQNLATQANVDLQNGNISVPIAQRVFFQVGFNGIAQRARMIAELANSNDEDEVQDEMLALAREIRQTVTVLTSRAEQLGNQRLLNILAVWADLSEELVDDLD